MRPGLLPVLGFVVLAGCATPPPEAYVAETDSDAPRAGLDLGKNATGESCTQQQTGASAADVYCGTWQQPSAHVRGGGAGGDLQALATSSPWRTALNDRFSCGDPTRTTILGGQPAMLLQCTQRYGGWPHLAMVASIDGTAWYGDSVLPALPAMERSMGVLSGKVRAEAVSQTQNSGADSLLADRLAAKAFSSGDIGQYEGLMRAASRANAVENFAAAEVAFRAALALQTKALGPEDPNTVAAVLNLALQVSNQHRFVEADALFARADRLAAKAADPSQQARLLHYRGLNLLNQGKREEALAQLDQAEAAYMALLPPSVLNARPVPTTTNILGNSTAGTTDLLPNRDLLSDVTVRAALLGLIEVRRNRAIVLRGMGRLPESQAALQSAMDIAQANGLRQPVLTARLARTEAAITAAAGDASGAQAQFARAANAYAAVFPESRPVAETLLLRAGQMQRADRTDSALDVCQQAAELFRSLKVGTTGTLLQPCLDVLAAAADRAPSQRQKLLAEMFEMSQISQGGVTSQQIAQATARLSENARDPKVAEAIRRRQDAGQALADLYRQRDQIEQQKGQAGAAAAPPDLDKRIAAAQTNVAEADAALQAASPNYGQLVQQVSPASEVMAALGPGEAFVAITLTDTGGWTFLLRDGQIAVAPVQGGLPRMAELVKRVRGGIESETGAVPKFDTEAAQQVYAATLGGLGDRLATAKAMVVAPSGPLLSMPFEVMLTGAAQPDNLANAPWLVRQMVISHVPAAANFVSLRKVAGGSRAGRPWFGFGDFRPVTLAQAQRSFGPGCADSAKLFAGLPPLPFATRELDAARKLLGADSADEMLGTAFTAEAVRKRALKDYRILHFATHALLPAELRCQTEPAIITSAPPNAADASGAMLTSSSVVGLDLDADSVILSACNSGGPGGGTAGESLSGLARAFFYAGARSLMVTHWSVNDQTAAYLVADTLRRYRESAGGGMAAALRDAQLGMLAEAGHGLPADVAHPFYWAPFALIGEGGTARRQAADAAADAGGVPVRHVAGL